MLIAKKRTYARTNPLGRPPVDPELEKLVLKLLQQNPTWGSNRIVGALANLGYTLSDSTIDNIRHRNGVPPAPERGNDHGTDPEPNRGYPYLASSMADNDLALGRIVEFLSQTPYWKNMVIFVTEDDAGGEPDHVDAQRSVLLVISPWARRSNVSHRHTTIVSMHRTLYEIFGLPPLNMFDALANDFSDCFTTQPDFRPYQCFPMDPRIFDPEKAKDPKDPDYGKARLLPSFPMDDPDEINKVLRRGEAETSPR